MIQGFGFLCLLDSNYTEILDGTQLAALAAGEGIFLKLNI